MIISLEFEIQVPAKLKICLEMSLGMDMESIGYWEEAFMDLL